jgi:Phage tail sheath C-terminal domain/Phage tail sheath protein subtilisin-like domain
MAAGGPWAPGTVGVGRPGIFINFITTAIAAINPAAKGTVALAVRASWGPDNVVNPCFSQSDLINFYGTNETAPYNAFYAGKNALWGGATRLNIYRMESAGTPGTKATKIFLDGAAATEFTLTGKYNGVRGNNFTVTVQVDAVDATKTDVILFESGVQLAIWTNKLVNRAIAGHTADIVATINNDPLNFWVIAAVTGTDLVGAPSTPASITATAMAGGGDGAALVTADYSAAMTALEAFQFDTFTVDVTETDLSGITATIDAWILNQRNYGKRVFWVMGSSLGETAATAQANAILRNKEYVSYVWPGVKQLNYAGAQVTYRGAAFAAQLAGMKASLGYGTGFTNRLLVNVIDLETRPLNAVATINITAGVLTLIVDSDQKPKMDKGITTLTNVSTAYPGKVLPASFKKVSIVNTIDALANSITISANENYVGMVPNDDLGQKSLMSVTRDFLQWLAGQRGIKGGYTVDLDPGNPSVGDRVFLILGVTPIDTMDFIYFTVVIGT